MRIFCNELEHHTQSGQTINELRQKLKPDADILIRNGYPASPEQLLEDGDHIWLIRQGERPAVAEIERLLIARHTPGVHSKIKNSTVGIAGVGGLGSQIAVALARVGIGRLIIADFDIIDPTNLNRQQYFIDQIGMFKVTALTDNLRRINPATEVIAHQTRIHYHNVNQVFSNVDILVEAFDSPDQKALLANFWLTHHRDKPLITGSGMAGYGPSNTITTTKVSKNFYVCGDRNTAAGPGIGLMAPRVGIAAHHQANAVLRLLLNQNPEETESI